MDKRANILICGALSTPFVVAAVEWDFNGNLSSPDLTRMGVSAALWTLYVGGLFAIVTMRRPLPRFFLVWFSVAAPLVIREIIRAVFHYQGMGWWFGLVSGGILAGAAVLVSLLFESLGWLGTVKRTQERKAAAPEVNREQPDRV